MLATLSTICHLALLADAHFAAIDFSDTLDRAGHEDLDRFGIEAVRTTRAVFNRALADAFHGLFDGVQVLTGLSLAVDDGAIVAT